MPTSAPPPRPPSRTSRRVAIVLGSVLVALVLGEAGLRVALRLRGDPWDAEAAAERVRALATGMNARLPDPRGAAPAAGTEPGTHVLHPYYGVDREGDVAELEAKARRFRAGEYDDAYVVVTLGGSVCALTVNEQHERIRAAIAADPRLANRRVELVNQGRGAFKAPQQATLLEYLFALGWRPDAVVEIDGFNEVAIPNGNWKSNVHPVQPMWGTWGLLAADRSDRSRELVLASECLLLAREGSQTAERLLASGELSSAILGRVGVKRMVRIQSRWSAAQGEYARFLAEQTSSRAARGPVFEATEDEAWPQFVDTWFENSRSLAASCAARGITYVHVLQPTLHDEGSKPLTEAERASSDGPKPWMKGAKRGYPMLREAGKRLAAEGVGFVDLSLLFRDLTEPTYYDVCHFRGRGQELFADAIVEALRARLPAEIPAKRAWTRAR
ncbi:MAG: hypothetical protein IPJ77_15420 [Planctomycetes bacterium]|nr:hypothetical protein [Planctomycetota bacterium]